ncbi:MAG: DMT family transporter [Erysipelotrichaceae bacterium]|nr:DMT family transporter [Erysipelotrichaceae bacterium]
MKRSQANGILILVAMVWGAGFIATDGALEGFTPFWMVSIRFVIAGLLLLPFAWRGLRGVSSHDIGKGCLAGILLFLAFAFQTIGLQYTTPSKNAFLTAVNVVLVPYLIWLLMKHRPTRKQVLCSLTCMIGVALLTLDGGLSNFSKGDVLSLICAVFFALHMMSLERYSHIPPLSLTALQLLSAGISATLIALCTEPFPHLPSTRAFGSLLFLIFGSTLLAYLLQTWAQQHTSANTTSLILTMEALFASLFSFLLLHEVMSVKMIIGGLIIFASVVIMEWHPKGNQL